MTTETANEPTNFYERLGVERDATQAEIRHAWMVRATALHPDRGGGADALSAVNEAYNVLKNPEKRASYDRGEDPRLFDAKNTDKPAIAIIGGMFKNAINQVIDTDDPITIDLVSEVRKGLRKAAADLERGNKIVGRKVARLRVIMKKTSKRAGGTNILVATLDNEARNMDRAILQNEEQLGHVRRALEIMDEYDFDVDVVEHTMRSSSAFGFGGDFLSTTSNG